MTNGHRIPQDAGDTIRDLQRRLIAQERRPGVPNIKQYIGNGIAPQARHIIDWNDVNIFQNGWYYSEELSINGPDQESAWIGQVIVAKGGHGIMQVWQHSAGTTGAPVSYVRSFHYHGPPEPPEFSTWRSQGDTWQSFGSIVAPEGGSFSNATIAMRYSRNGNTVKYNARIELFDIGTGSGAFRFTVPFFASGIGAVGTVREYQSTGWMGWAQINPGEEVVTVLRYDNLSMLASGRKFLASGTYECAP